MNKHIVSIASIVMLTTVNPSNVQAEKNTVTVNGRGMVEIYGNGFFNDINGNQIYHYGSVLINGTTYYSASGPVVMQNGQIISWVTVDRANTEKAIEATGKVVEREFNTPIESVSVPGVIAPVYINDKQRPRIECDSSCSDLLFHVRNGELSLDTKDGKPRTFIIDGKPFCKVYAQLLGNGIKASNNAEVFVDTNSLNNIRTSDTASVSGFLRGEHKNISLDAEDASSINVQGIHSNSMNVEVSDSAIITASGNVHTQNVNVSNSASYRGSQLQSFITKIKASNCAKAFLNVKNLLYGKESMMSEIKCSGDASFDVKRRKF